MPAVLSWALTRVFTPFNRPHTLNSQVPFLPRDGDEHATCDALAVQATHTVRARRQHAAGRGAIAPMQEATTKVLLDSEAKLERTRNAHTPVCILHRLRRRSTATASTLTHANSRTASLGHPGRSG